LSPGDAFAECTEVAKESFRRLAPFIEQISGGRFVALDRGALAVYLQKRFGDVLLQLAGTVATLELKAEEKNTGNVFYEVYSNLVGARRAHYEIANRVGWGFSSQSTLTVYHFLDDDTLLVWDTLRVKRWAFGYWQKDGTWRAGQLFRGDQRGPEFPERPHTKRAQQNNSVGRLVPHRVLLNECGAVRLRVGQGELFEQPFTAAA
jgi:hypothetical protein